MNNYYYAKIKGLFINYLNLFSTEKPLRLKNTTLESESILYTKEDIRKLKQLHPNLRGYIKYRK